MPSRKIKILYTETYTHVAGGQKGLLDLVKYIDKEQFDPIVLIQGKGRLSEGLEKLGIPYMIQRMEPFKNRWLPFSWLLGVPTCEKVIRHIKPDVVHSNHLYVGRYSGRAAKRCGVPSLVTLRLVHTPEIYDKYNRWNTMKVHHKVVSNSEEGRKVHLGDPEVSHIIQTIKNGMDLSVFYPFSKEKKKQLKHEFCTEYNIPQNALLISQIASLVPQKGNEILLQAFLDLSSKHSNTHLVFVGGSFGKTSNQEKLESMAEQAGCRNRVHFTSFVWNVSEFLNIMDVSVLASKEREGLPRALIEAMCCGNPIIGTDVGGVSELVTSDYNGYLIPPNDSGAMKQSLDQLIANPDKRAVMGNNGLQRAQEHHDIRKMIQKYQDIYLELAGAV